VSPTQYPNMTQLEICYKDGSLKLKAPGMDSVPITAQDMTYSVNCEVIINMLRMEVKTIYVNEACDRLVSQYLLGNMY
jgi:hypothetical protein